MYFGSRASASWGAPGNLVTTNTLYHPSGAPSLPSVETLYVPSGPMLPAEVPLWVLPLDSSPTKLTVPLVRGVPSSVTFPDTDAVFGPEGPQPGKVATAARSANPNNESRPLKVYIMKCSLIPKKYSRTRIEGRESLSYG